MQNPFDLEKLIQSVSSEEFHFIPVTEVQLRFIAQQSLVTLQKIYAVLAPENELDPNSLWGLKLPKKYDLSVSETLALRKDKFDTAKRKELLADIGESKGCSKEKALKILTDPDQWEFLPEEVQDKLNDLLIGQLDDKPEAYNARLITTIIQSRLIKNWLLDETLMMPQSIVEAFLGYIQNEQDGWGKEVIDTTAITVIATDVTGQSKRGKQQQPSEVNPTGGSIFLDLVQWGTYRPNDLKEYLATPTSVILWIWQGIRYRNLEQINDQSRAIAKQSLLIEMAFAGFGGQSDRVELSIDRYLPFDLPDPSDPESARKTEYRRMISQATADKFWELRKAGLPDYVERAFIVNKELLSILVGLKR